MKLRLNYRLVLVITVLGILAVGEVAREIRPSFLRPGLHLFAYVGNTADGTLSAIDLVKLSPAATIPVGPEPSGIRANPVRKEIWGLSSGGGYAWVLDVNTNQIVARIPVGAAPFALDFSPDGSRAYVAASGSNAVVAIDCASRQIVARARAGRRPWIARVSPDGKILIVSNRDDSTVSILDANSLASRGVVAVAPAPEQIAILPDGSKAFVTSGTQD
jgi:YVTN family beta-propeller protein